MNESINLLATQKTAESFKTSMILEVGQWYWVRCKPPTYDVDTYPVNPPDKLYPWLACAVKIGSNFVDMRSMSRHGERSDRIHFDVFEELTIYEPNYRKVIRENTECHRQRANAHLNEIKQITSRLGISSQAALTDDNDVSKALVPSQGQSDFDGYKKSLVKAKDEDLPQLFEKVKYENELLTMWMGAEAIVVAAHLDSMEGVLEAIGGRIFNVSLYAGLTEQVVHVREGKTGAYADTVHLMQRKLYMDEECLLEYEAGGMEFGNIRAFDKWISRTANFKRCLPFSKTIVAFQVRRNKKERETAPDLLSKFIKFDLEDADKITFLYIRNGNNLYRLNCDLRFGTKIFPDRTDFDPQESMMAKMFAQRVDGLMPRREYDEFVRLYKEKEEKRKQWFVDNPRTKWEKANPNCISWEWSNPYRDISHDNPEQNYEPFDKSNVHYDEILKTITDQIEQYNRIALIVQGLFDRSEVLHPHPVVKSWIDTDFQSMIKLVYDGSDVLYENESPPDFEAYRHECNASADIKSVFVGQERFWEVREAEKESDRRDTDWRCDSSYRPTYFHPYGNPGPGYIARAVVFHPRVRKVTFEWMRERLTYHYWKEGDIKARITVPLSALFNISAYQIGDYKQFFQDPRTRADYIKWAPMLLAAEDYHAGKRVI